MFERYTETARRTIFFARYEASQYGSPKIETEHLLLGILREDRRLVKILLRETGACELIRKEIEAQTMRHERIPASVEVPLSQDAKMILRYAVESAEKLGHRYIDAIHLVLGILRIEDCIASRILESHGVDEETIRRVVEKRIWSAESELGGIGGIVLSAQRRADLQAIAESLVEIWAIRDVSRFFGLFARSGQFWDSKGKSWSGAEVRTGIQAQFEAHKIDVEEVALEQISTVTRNGAVVTLRLKATNKSSQQLVAFLLDGGANWKIVSAHLSLNESF
jgi:hypothetical protein